MNIKNILKWLIPIGLLFFICIAFTGITGGLSYLSARNGEDADSASGGERPSTGFSFAELLQGINPFADKSAEPNSDGSFSDLGGANQIFVPVFNKPLVSSTNSATLQTIHGIAQLQNPDGSWQTVETIELTEGQTVRTWDYSSASIHFFDGSYLVLDANTRVTLETVKAPMDGDREITLFQPYGSTTHDVAGLISYSIAYDVRTPSSTGSAKGTVFEVVVNEDKSSQFTVVEGAVDVTGKSDTVQLTAGLTSYVENGEEPEDPVFWISGEGEVTQTGATWIIGGLDFDTHSGTIIIGDPQVGDLVSVRGRLLTDGTRLADEITLLLPAIEESFRLTGVVDSMGSDLWVVAGQDIHVDGTTQIDGDIVVGSQVLVTGVIQEGGVLFAESISLLEEDAMYFEFTGLVEDITGDLWTISGVVITKDENTEITGDPVVGDLVHVEGHILEDGTWLADEIEKVSELNQFEIIGTVDSIAPWMVSSVGFDVNEYTQIEPGIIIGSLVRVTGMILEDGTWLANSIELLEETNTLVFIGIVDSIDPWMVNGLTLPTDANTQIIGDIQVGSLVRVTVLIQPDGTWLTLSIELIDVGPVIGCIEFVDTVVGLTDNEITLATGLVIPRAIAEVEGELQVGSLVVIKLCFGPDEVMVYAWILVITDIFPTPTPTPEPIGTPVPGDKVTICHIPPGNPGNAHTITIGAPAVDAHLGHGDHLGPCTGNEGGDSSKDDKKDNGKKDD